MTNDDENEKNDDFVDSDFELEETPEQTSGMPSESWSNRPLFKFMVLVIAVFAVGAGAVTFFGSDDDTRSPTRLTKPPSFHQAPGGEASPYHREQTQKASEQRAEEALRSGTSAIQTPLGQNIDSAAFGTQRKKEDPLKELRAETELLKRQMQETRRMQREPFDKTLSRAMQRQMGQLMDSWVPGGITTMTVSENTSAEVNLASTGRETMPAPVAAPAKVIVRAGTVSYAQLLTEANSDVPGPILAQIVSGPLSGSRAVGSFQVAYSYDKYLVMRFKLADKDGKEYSIDALALDPETTLGGVATEVDERYFARVVLPSAASFLSTFGSAIGSPESEITTNGTTTIVTQSRTGVRDGLYAGLGKSAETVGEFFKQQGKMTKPLVRAAPGTAIGLFFVSAVVEPSANAAPASMSDLYATQQTWEGNYPERQRGRPQEDLNGQASGSSRYYGTTSGYNNSVPQQGVYFGSPY